MCCTDNLLHLLVIYGPGEGLLFLFADHNTSNEKRNNAWYPLGVTSRIHSAFITALANWMSDLRSNGTHFS